MESHIPKPIKPPRRGRLTKSRPVESPKSSSSSSLSSSDELPEEDTRGSRNRLVSRLKSAKPSVARSKPHPSAKPSEEEPETPKQPPVKESSIAQSIKRRFAFFRKSENVKSSEDVEATTTPEPSNRMDVVVDVHTENESRKTRKRSPVVLLETSTPDSLDLIEEFDSGDDERQPTVSGRRRWDKTEIPADDLVEDLKKPKRRQWTEGSNSAEIRDITGKKIVVPKRAATAEPTKTLGDKKHSAPVAAPRTRNPPKQEEDQDQKGFDNEGFSSDHDEVLRIETMNDRSPKIQMSSSVEIERIEDLTSAQSEEDRLSESNHSIVMIKEYNPKGEESSDSSESSSLSRSNELLKMNKVSRRRPRSKRKTSEDEEEEEEDQETVLNVIEKKSRQSSSSSKMDIIPRNFFKRKSSDETTISTNEEMRLTRRESRASRLMPKPSRKDKSDENASSRSSKRKTSSSARNSTEELPAQRSRSRMKKRHRKKDKHRKPKKYDEEEDLKYVSVKIHRTDILEADYITRHPMVKVHIMNAETGDYAKHIDDQGPLEPIVTQKFDFKEMKTMMPVWEEDLVFEMNYKQLVAEGRSSTILLFEIVDLMTFNETSSIYDQYVGRDGCWHKVAWAFLRPIGVDGTSHVGKIVRLQLYKPKRSFRRSKSIKTEVYKWWKTNFREKYPASLYVSVLAVDPPRVESVTYEQLMPLNEKDVEESAKNASVKSEEQPKSEEPVTKWTRHAAQSCQIPNEHFLETEISDNGCFCVAFSNNGKYLACVLADEYEYPILLYKIEEGKIYCRFDGHKNFVYALSWSQDDRFLLSVSSDQTARLWDVRELIIEDMQSLPHPSYVYCGKFFPDAQHFIVTGCYDNIARIWARPKSSRSRPYELVQELEGHKSFVNSVCIQAKVETVITGDGLGIILIWMVKKSRRSPIKREWAISRKIKIKELEGVPINSLLLTPMGSRLLVHSRNDGLKLLDLASGVAVRKFEGLKNHRIQLTSCISPCGSLLFCGGEDSTLNVWNMENGKLLATYEVQGWDKAVSCVDYHPYDHVMAFTIYGAPVPVKILKYDRDADGKKVGLKFHNSTTSFISDDSLSQMKELHQPPVVRNGIRHLEVPYGRSLNSSSISQVGSIDKLINDYKDESGGRRYSKGNLQKFIVESGPNLKTKSMNRLNGIIEKIDRILMYATSQKSPAVDLEAGRNHQSIFTIEDKISKEPSRNLEIFEMQEIPSEKAKTKGERRVKKHRHRSRSARNACSPTSKEIESAKAFSDSAAFIRKVSKFSDDSSSTVQDKFIVENIEMRKLGDPDTEPGLKDSLDTIVDGKEDFPSEEVLDVESLKSDDTYIVDKKPEKDGSSDRSNATFTIESEIPVPKPRRRSRVEVM